MHKYTISFSAIQNGRPMQLIFIIIVSYYYVSLKIEYKKDNKYGKCSTPKLTGSLPVFKQYN